MSQWHSSNLYQHFEVHTYIGKKTLQGKKEEERTKTIHRVLSECCLVFS